MNIYDCFLGFFLSDFLHKTTKKKTTKTKKKLALSSQEGGVTNQHGLYSCVWSNTLIR